MDTGRKEGFEAPALSPLGVPPVGRRMEKRGEETVIESRSLFCDRCSDRGFLSFIRPLPLSAPPPPHLPLPSHLPFSSFYIPSLLSSLSLIFTLSAPSPLLLISSLKRLNKSNKMPNEGQGPGKWAGKPH